MDYSIPARKPDLVLINKKITFHLVVFTIPADHRVKVKEGQKLDKYLDLASCSQWNSLQELGKETEETGDQRKNQHHLDHRAAKIS